MSKLSRFEFVTLMALLMSLAALAIDAMLPALPLIGADLNVLAANDTQKMITFLFLGMSIGQLFYGPLSDAKGRKPVIYIGIFIFLVGCFISIFSQSFSIMLLGRFLQGLGVASTRVVTIAIVRDQYSGIAMAKIMSLITMVFIIVPAIAPSIGQGILLFAHWRAIFWVFVLLSTVGVIWFWLRQEETLSLAKRKPLSLTHFKKASMRIIGHPVTMGYTIAAGLIFGAFIGYLVSSQQIFQNVFNLGKEFPLYFGVLAISIGCASYINSKLVDRFGMTTLTFWATSGIFLLSLCFLTFISFNNGLSPFSIFMLYMILSFACIGILFGNFNSLAMEPMGDIAGMATAVTSSVQNILSIGLGTLIGSKFSGNLYPLTIGFLGLSFLTLIVITIIPRLSHPD